MDNGQLKDESGKWKIRDGFPVPCHSEAAQQPWESVFLRCEAPRRLWRQGVRIATPLSRLAMTIPSDVRCSYTDNGTAMPSRFLYFVMMNWLRHELMTSHHELLQGNMN